MNNPHYHVLRKTNIRGADPDFILGTVLYAKKIQAIDKKYELTNLLDKLMKRACVGSEEFNSPSEKVDISEVFQKVASNDRNFKKEIRKIIADIRAESSHDGNY